MYNLIDHHHVHFSEDTDEIGHTLINIKFKNNSDIEAHVGFLQVTMIANRVYTILMIYK